MADLKGVLSFIDEEPAYTPDIVPTEEEGVFIDANCEYFTYVVQKEEGGAKVFVKAVNEDKTETVKVLLYTIHGECPNAIILDKLKKDFEKNMTLFCMAYLYNTGFIED